ncbi:hypothetical protein AX16_005445 [Volvariella volvacea WC 439]|nr:hypothetical protein AX16_005445 [Volvariella volvacea WC 439]
MLPFVSDHHIPNDAVVNQVKLQVIKPCTKQLEELKAQIRYLEQRHDAITLHLNRHRAFISPMRVLPHDVLREIFLHCLPTDHFSPIKTSEAPLLLGRVCGAWREVAMGTPQLWASIHIPYDNQFRRTFHAKAVLNKTWERRLAGISSWLSRSGALPLSISFHYHSDTWISSEDPWIADPPCMSSLLDLLFSFKSRWRHVRISAEGPLNFLPSSPADMELEPNSFPALESFAVCPNWKKINYPSTMLKAPRIRELVTEVPAWGEQFNTHYHQLTSLSIRFLSFDDIGIRNHLPTILTQCHSLVEFNLHIPQGVHGRLPQFPPVYFPKLQRLALNVDMSWLVIFSSSHMPKLKELKVTCSYCYSAEDESSIRSFFAALPPLETLVLAICRLNRPESVVEGLRSQSRLKNLVLEDQCPRLNQDDTVKLMDGLTVGLGSPTEPPVLPCLESFTHRNTFVHDRHYKSFILSRTQLRVGSDFPPGTVGVTPLKRAHITFRRSRVIDLLADPEVSAACAASGLDLTVHYPVLYEHPFVADLGLVVECDAARAGVEDRKADGYAEDGDDEPCNYTATHNL